MKHNVRNVLSCDVNRFRDSDTRPRNESCRAEATTIDLTSKAYRLPPTMKICSVDSRLALIIIRGYRCEKNQASVNDQAETSLVLCKVPQHYSETLS